MAAPRLLDVSTRVEVSGTSPPRPGDSVRLVLAARFDGEAELRVPEAAALEKALGGDGLVLSGPVRTGGDGLVEAAWTVQVLLPPGVHEMGPVAIALVDASGEVLEELEAPAAPFEVVSALSPDLARALDQAAEQGALPQLVAEQLAPVRGPWMLAGRTPWSLVLGSSALVVLLALLAAWALRRRLRRRPAAPLPAARLPAPDVEALERLAELPALLDRGEHLAFHVELARVLKRYLGRRYGADLLELTTDEVRHLLLGPLRAASNLGRMRETVTQTLSACDLVKFARDLPTRDESMRLLHAVEGVVVRTSPAPPSRQEVAA